MKAILIDPATRTISEVEYNGDYRQIYKLIDAKLFEVVMLGRYLSQSQTLFVDEEGLLHAPKPLFKIKTYHQPLAGKGLILGETSEGESVETKMTVAQVEALVTWPDIEFAGFDPIPEGATVDHPVLGPNIPIVGHHPVFRKKS